MGCQLIDSLILSMGTVHKGFLGCAQAVRRISIYDRECDGLSAH